MTVARSAVMLGASAVFLVGCAADAAVVEPAPAEPGQDADPSAQPTATEQPPAADDAALSDGVYDGPRVTNARGGYQAQVTVEGGLIVNVAPIEAGTATPESQRVNGFAMPAIVERVLEAQSADVEHVSGSSFTSPAMLESIEGALEAARS